MKEVIKAVLVLVIGWHVLFPITVPVTEIIIITLLKDRVISHSIAVHSIEYCEWWCDTILTTLEDNNKVIYMGGK